jgi:hypothetical protein
MALAGQRRVATIYVHTPPDLAFTLYRTREGRDISEDAFFALRASAVEAETTDLFAVADAILYNWIGSSYGRAIDGLMAAVH